MRNARAITPQGGEISARALLSLVLLLLLVFDLSACDCCA